MLVRLPAVMDQSKPVPEPEAHERGDPERAISPNTAKRLLGQVREFIRFAIGRGWITQDGGAEVSEDRHKTGAERTVQ